MKVTREPFDDELSERLRQYTEEPDKDLWAGIVSRIGTVPAEPNWVLWSQQISGIIMVGTAIFVYGFQPVLEKEGTAKLPVATAQEQSLRVTNEAKGANPGTGHPLGRVAADQMGIGKRLDKSNAFVSNSDGDRSKTNGSKIVTYYEETEKMANSNVTLNEQGIENSLDERLTNPTLSADTVVVPKKGSSLDTLRKAQAPRESINRAPQRHRAYTFYLTAMPTFGYQRVESNKADNIQIESIESVPAFSSQRLGVRIELGMEFPVSKKLSVFGGLLYFQRKQTIGYTEKILDSTSVASGPSGGILVEPHFSYMKKSFEYELRNLGVQVGLLYKLSNDKPRILTTEDALTSKTMQPKKKFLHLIGGGLEFHKALNETTAFNNSEGFTNPSMYVFCNVYYRLQYPSEGKLRAIFQPTFNYSFYINENLNAPFYVKPYGFGLNFGCTYNF